jgi:TPR repeat protein
MKLKLRIFGALVLACAACPIVHAAGPAGNGDQQDAASGRSSRVFAATTDDERKASQQALLAGKGDAAALERLQRAADAGDAYAQFQLSLLYRDGRGVPKDSAQYVRLLRKAAEQGHLGAQVRLIGICEEGQGAPKDLGQAAGWARRAAEQGDPGGLATLVVDYYDGRGVPRNYVLAVKWHTIALAIGASADGGDFSSELERRAGPLQVAEGQTLAREWLAAHHVQK